MGNEIQGHKGQGSGESPLGPVKTLATCREVHASVHKIVTQARVDSNASPFVQCTIVILIAL